MSKDENNAESATQESASGESSSDANIYENRGTSKIIRVITVLAYMFSVSFIAIVLSAYYIFLWEPPNVKFLRAERLRIDPVPEFLITDHADRYENWQKNLFRSTPRRVQGRIADEENANDETEEWSDESLALLKKSLLEIFEEKHASGHAAGNGRSNNATAEEGKSVYSGGKSLEVAGNANWTESSNASFGSLVKTPMDNSSASVPRDEGRNQTFGSNTTSKVTNEDFYNAVFRKFESSGNSSQKHVGDSTQSLIWWPYFNRTFNRSSIIDEKNGTGDAIVANSSRILHSRDTGISDDKGLSEKETSETSIWFDSPKLGLQRSRAASITEGLIMIFRMQLPRKMSAQNVMATITRTLGSRESKPAATNEVRLAGDERKDKLYEPKHKQKLVRVLTVVAYVIFVSMAAILLSLYYTFLWDPQDQIKAVRVNRPDCTNVRIINTLNAQPLSHSKNETRPEKMTTKSPILNYEYFEESLPTTTPGPRNLLEILTRSTESEPVSSDSSTTSTSTTDQQTDFSTTSTTT